MTQPTDTPVDLDKVMLGLRWGIKASFLAYIAGMNDGRATATDGAQPTERDELVFEPAPDVSPDGADAADHAWAFRGDVRFSGHFGMLYVRVADPWIVLRDGHGELSVPHMGKPDTEPRIRLVTFELQQLRAPAGLEVWSGTDVRLTEEGVESFNEVYAAGEPFEPIVIALAAPQG